MGARVANHDGNGAAAGAVAAAGEGNLDIAQMIRQLREFIQGDAGEQQADNENNEFDNFNEDIDEFDW